MNTSVPFGVPSLCRPEPEKKQCSHNAKGTLHIQFCVSCATHQSTKELEKDNIGHWGLCGVY